jgi:hypothetical protein
VFRDETSLSASPELWAAIETALSQARFFVLLASPEAADSRWVDWRSRRYRRLHVLGARTYAQGRRECVCLRLGGHGLLLGARDASLVSSLIREGRGVRAIRLLIPKERHAIDASLIFGWRLDGPHLVGHVARNPADLVEVFGHGIRIGCAAYRKVPDRVRRFAADGIDLVGPIGATRAAVSRVSRNDKQGEDCSHRADKGCAGREDAAETGEERCNSPFRRLGLIHVAVVVLLLHPIVGKARPQSERPGPLGGLAHLVDLLPITDESVA